MAKPEITAITMMTKKAKWLNFLKILGICFGGMVGLVAGVVLYVWATGGFKPPYVPLDNTWHFSQSEYVIDGNNEVSEDKDGKQVFDDNGNVKWVQKTDKDGNVIYEMVMIVPNDGCTELNAVLKLSDSTNNQMNVQLVEDDNVSAVKDETEPSTEDTTKTETKNGTEKTEENEKTDIIYDTYNVKINNPIYLRPITTKTTYNGIEYTTNIGGWVKLTATQGLLTTSCWVYVDNPIEKYNLSVNEKLESGTNDETKVTTYSIYENSNVSFTENVFPNSNITPASVFANMVSSMGSAWKHDKTSSDFTETRSFSFESSNKDIAEVDPLTNKLIIAKNSSGKSFYIKSYIIAKYNDIKNVPNINDSKYTTLQEPEVVYNADFDKIRIWSNIVYFTIKPIIVSGISNIDKNSIIPVYNVFESGNLDFSTIGAVSKSHFLIDIELSQENQDYKTQLMKYIEIYTGVASKNTLSEEASTGGITLEDGKDIVVNGKLITLTKKYFEVKKTTTDYTWSYKCNEYIDGFNYLIFAYPISQDEEKGTISYICTYNAFTIQKTAVSSVSTSISSISTEYDATNTNENVYSLKDVVVTVSPSNATYTKTMFFVPSDQNIVITADASAVTKFNGIDYVAVAVEISKDGETSYDYKTLQFSGIGSTSLYAFVIRTDADGNILKDSEDKQIYEVEYSSDAIVVTSNKKVIFGDLKILTDKTGAVLHNITVDTKDPNIVSYTTNAGNVIKVKTENNKKTLSVSNLSSVDAELYFQFIYDGDADALDNLEIYSTKSDFVKVLGKSSETKNDENFYTFFTKSYGESAGDAQVIVKYNGNTIYQVSFELTSTELTNLDLSFDSNISSDFTVQFTKDAQNNIITGYNWEPVAPALSYRSPSTTSKQIYFKSYQIPTSYYNGNELDKDEIIKKLNDLKELNYSSGSELKTFIDSLTEDVDILKISTDETVESSLINTISYYNFEIKTSGACLLVAYSISNGIASNPILINATLPTIVVNKKVDGNIVSYGEMKSVDGNIIPARTISITDYVSCTVDGYDISSLLKFKFANQTDIKDGNDEYYVSKKSGAKILCGDVGKWNRMTLCNINQDSISEQITAYTDFGYIETNAYTFTLQQNYKWTPGAKSSITFKTPQIIDLFKGISESDIPFLVTNRNFDVNATDAVNGNRLYITKNYSSYKTSLSTAFLNKFYYEDSIGTGSYYHIYNDLSFVDINDIASDGGNGLVTLAYQSETNYTTRLSFLTSGGYAIPLTIYTNPGITIEGIGAGNKISTSYNATSNGEYPLKDLIKGQPTDSSYSLTASNILFNVDETYNQNFIFSDDTFKTFVSATTPIEATGEYYKVGDSYVAVSTPKDDYLKTYYEMISALSYNELLTYYKQNIYYIYTSGVDSSNFGNYYYKNGSNYSPAINTVYDSSLKYYSQCTNYVVASDVTSENVTNYYLFQLTTDKSIDTSKTYYNHLTYDAIDSDTLDSYIKTNDSILDELYQTTEVTLAPDGKLTTNENFNNIISDLVLKFKAKVTIKNKDGSSTPITVYIELTLNAL